MVSILLTIMEKVPNTDGRLLEWEIYPQGICGISGAMAARQATKKGLGSLWFSPFLVHVNENMAGMGEAVEGLGIWHALMPSPVPSLVLWSVAGR